MNEGQRIAQLEADHRHLHDCLHRIENTVKVEMEKLNKQRDEDREAIQKQRVADQRRNDERIRWMFFAVLGATLLTGGGTISLKTVVALIQALKLFG